MRLLLAAASFVACTTACSTMSPMRGTTAGAVGTRSLAGVQPAPAQMIRRGHIGVTVEHVDDQRRHLEHAATALGADLMRLEAREHERADYLFRVPPEHLEALMDSAASLGSAGERTISADEVSAQVVDAEGRLAGLQASRDRLQQLMARATSVGDVITVERELARVQEELESLQGRLNALRGQVAMSELAVDLEKHHVLGPVSVLLVGIGHALGKLFILR